MSYIPFGTIASQNANNVSITGGSITGITDLTITDGGTGASTAQSALENLGLVKVTVTGINGLVTGKTTLFTVPSGKNFIIQMAMVRLTALTGVATVGAMKIIDDTDGVDLIGITTLTSLTAVEKGFPLLLPSSVIPTPAAGQVIKAEITTAFSVATTVTLSVDLIGYLI